MEFVYVSFHLVSFWLDAGNNGASRVCILKKLAFFEVGTFNWCCRIW